MPIQLLGASSRLPVIVVMMAFRAMTSLLVEASREGGLALASEIYSPHLDLHQRLLILDVMAAAATEMSTPLSTARAALKDHLQVLYPSHRGSSINIRQEYHKSTLNPDRSYSRRLSCDLLTLHAGSFSARPCTAPCRWAAGRLSCRENPQVGPEQPGAAEGAEEDLPQQAKNSPTYTHQRCPLMWTCVAEPKGS